MRTTMIPIVGMIFTAMTMMAADGPSQEERYRAKYGRYTPAYEARMAAKPSAPIVAEAIPACCRSLHASQLRPTLAEEGNRVKYGRYSPAGEALARVAMADTETHGRACLGLDQCAKAAITSDEARSLAKSGRAFGRKVAPIAFAAARHFDPCEHACCQ